LRKAVVERARSDEFDVGVAEELEALIVDVETPT
jgi:hypothetical protein